MNQPLHGAVKSSILEGLVHESQPECDTVSYDTGASGSNDGTVSQVVIWNKF